MNSRFGFTLNITKILKIPVKHLFQQLADALEFIHSRHIVHRDVSVSNLLLDEHGNLKLGMRDILANNKSQFIPADFGIARRTSREPMTPGVVTVINVRKIIAGSIDFEDMVQSSRDSLRRSKLFHAN